MYQRETVVGSRNRHAARQDARVCHLIVRPSRLSDRTDVYRRDDGVSPGDDRHMYTGVSYPSGIGRRWFRLSTPFRALPCSGFGGWEKWADFTRPVPTRGT